MLLNTAWRGKGTMIRGSLADKPLGNALADSGERYPNLMVVDADMQRATESYLFQQRFPERHINVGIAEANMVSISAGLALSGKIVFCGTFATFITQRVCDQVVISVAYCRANVKLLGVEAGLASAHNGASHQAMLDLAIMRAIPNMSVFVPGDAVETRAIVAYTLEHHGPVYIRVLRGKVPVLLDPNAYRFEAGQAVLMRAGHDLSIITCGAMLPRSLQAADQLAAEGISARVINMSSIKPLDEEAILDAASDTGCIITAEDHNILGGLGSAVAEVVTSRCPVPVIRVGVKDRFGEVGTPDWLAEKFGTSVRHITQAARQALDSKRRGPASKIDKR
jgi:transketolase